MFWNKKDQKSTKSTSVYEEILSSQKKRAEQIRKSTRSMDVATQRILVTMQNQNIYR